MSTNGDVRSVSSGFSGNKMATIPERSRSDRSKQGEDGFKVSFI
jgi:hypothetical protein